MKIEDDFINVLVVDNSAVMRNSITQILEKDENIRIIGKANNNQFALNKLRKTKADVVVLDYCAPDENELEALRTIHSDFDTQIVIFSSVDKNEVYRVLKSNNCKNFDFLNKPNFEDKKKSTEYIQRHLNSKIKNAYRKILRKQWDKGEDLSNTKEHILYNEEKERERHHTSLAKTKEHFIDIPKRPRKNTLVLKKKEKIKKVTPLKSLRSKIRFIVIGASSGGTMAIEHILRDLPADFVTPILIVQHLPRQFTRSFINQLSNATHLHVVEASHNETIQGGNIYIAPGNAHMKLEQLGGEYVITLDKDLPPVNSCRPSIDVLFESVAENVHEQVIAIILTGMGQDGAFGLERIKDSGGYTIAQDEKTSEIFGMPQKAIETGKVDVILPLGEIATWINKKL